MMFGNYNRRIRRKLCFGLYSILVLWSIGLVAEGWGRVGHEVVAAIAYDHLTPSVKRRVLYYNHALKPVYGELSVIKAAAWADWLRGHDIDVYASWHYIDLPYVVGHVPAPPLESQNVVWAIHKSAAILKSRHANAFEKGLFLRFLMHNMGDIHQPMHCVTRITDRFPSGDRGGNDLIIGEGKQNLHQVWDGAVGLFNGQLPPHANDHDIMVLARYLEKQYPPSKAALSPSLQPEDFARESYRIAKNVAYDLPPGAVLTRDYRERGQAIAGKQLVLAGYRLAMTLNSVFG